MRRLRHPPVQQVCPSGEIRWQGGFLYISEALISEPLAIPETETGDWSVGFYTHPLGGIDRAHNKQTNTPELLPMYPVQSVTRPLVGFSACKNLTPSYATALPASR